MYVTLTSIQAIYHELCEKLEAGGESHALKLKRHRQPSALDCPQAVVCKWHKDWLAHKVIIQDLHKIATDRHSERNAAHAHAPTLLQAMAACAPDGETRDPEFSGVEPTHPANRANFVESENIGQAD